MITSDFRRDEIIEKNAENAGVQHFLQFFIMFSNAFSFRAFQTKDCMVKD